MPFINKKEWATATCENMDESQKKNTQKKNTGFHLYNFKEQEKLIYCDRHKISAYLLGWEECGLEKGMRVMEMFSVLIWVMDL